MVSNEGIPVRVKQIRYESDSIVSVEFEALNGEELPAFEAGAHIDLILSDALRRSYSLCYPYEPSRFYSVAVHRDPESSGGSKYIHESLRVGDTIHVSVPKNNFPLLEDAGHTVLIAGGVGITPIFCMLRRLNDLGRSWELHYAARSRESAAFLKEIDSFEQSGRVFYHFKNDENCSLIDFDALFQARPDAHFYCCGPQSMLAAYESAGQVLPKSQVHLEYFSATQEAALDGGYEIVLQKSGKKLEIPPGESILDVLLKNNVSVPFACNDGVCGTCETRVLAGTPDHRDSILTDEEKKEGATMMVCCSGSRSALLVLDL